ncbi:MAG: hypothetical protein COW67_02260 [Flavobacteriales bacterium CG18_big_fil_WC_8_21_14_2_50_32_9]|nr:MAG: hypothetical protein COW67_02260 [Flavobacteriales bacterium CG18_big_fil_WC_8_21_14_2_50_32_9]PJC62071.1 MAG: hypothetical protein CO022_06410 [Flavobacteriales bacterium CG_4_9_14_0_2_um_filter_32_27]
MRYVIFILFFIYSLRSSAGDLSGTINGAFTVHILLGTQEKALNFGISIFGTSTYKSTSVEGGINVNISPFFQKYGIYQGNFAGSIEFFGLIGYGKNANLLGSNVGITRHTAFYDYTKTRNFFYGAGLVAVLNQTTGNLKKFDNKQGGLILRFSDKQNSVAFNMVNDVNARPFSKSGTDKGNTARAILSYSTIKNDELFGVGIGLDMFTPEADYGVVPHSHTNSEEDTRLVLVNTKPYDHLFHFNLFSSFVYQNDKLNFDARFGVDNYKLGALVQNIIHDNFGLYPRFSWPITQKGKFYSLLDFNAPFNINFND